MSRPLSRTGPSQPSTEQVVQVARSVMRRFEIRPENLQRTLHMPYPVAVIALDRLAGWGIVTAATGAPRRLVLVRPEHEPDVVQALRDHGGVVPDPNPLASLLVPAVSSRQREVLQLIADGLSFDEIAAELHMSHNTVKTHARRLYFLIGARRSLANLVHLAHLKGVLPFPDFQSGKDSR